MKKSNTISGKVYKFVHHTDVYIETNLTGRSFDSEWLSIEENGKITVKGSNGDGYAWDGCTPKINVIDLIIGTPDGRFDFETELPITYYASMIHDALYQYKSNIDLSRKEVDIIFKINLNKSTFKLRSIYFIFVRLFGGYYGKWNRTTSEKDISINKFSWLENSIPELTDLKRINL